MFKDILEETPVLGVLLIASILLLVFFIADAVFTTQKFFSGVVIDKRYAPEMTSTGVGTGVTSDGKPAAVVTTSHVDEKFLLMTKCTNGKVFTVKCSPEIFYTKSVGDTLFFTTSNGLFTGNTYSTKSTK
jgi:hypothetical protein